LKSQPIVSWDWFDRAEALRPQAVLAWGASALTLLERIEACSSDLQRRLLATAAPNFLMITGAVQDLPWIDGVQYAAPSPEQARLWLPTHSSPAVPIDLLARVINAQSDRDPYLLWRSPPILLPLDRLLPVTPSLLNLVRQKWQDSR
jgi:MoxR-vWA-beta-propeller ternary system domain bpX5